MKRATHWIVASTVIALAVAGLARSAELNADQIINRYVEARGGARAWQKIQTMAWEGHIKAAAGTATNAPFVLELKRPYMTRFEMIVTGQKSARVFNGERGWKLRSTHGGRPEVRDYTPEEVDFARDALGMDGPLVDYQAKGVAIALAGMDQIEGHKAYHLNITLPSGAVHRVWIDAHSFLELKYERDTHNRAGQAGIVAVYYRNYQTFKGLTIPFTIETGDPERPSDKMIIERIALNPELDDALFEGGGASHHRSAQTQTPTESSVPEGSGNAKN